MIKPRTKIAVTATTTIAYLVIAVMAAHPPTRAPSPAPTPTATPAPAPGPDCISAMINMADCLSYVENGSTLRKPDPQCCPEISDLISTQPVCLCKFLANSSQFDLSNIDTNRALKLPTLCNMSAPPVQLCAVIGVHLPGLAPSPSPASSLPEGRHNGSPTSNLLSSSKLIGLSLVLFTSLFY